MDTQTKKPALKNTYILFALCLFVLGCGESAKERADRIHADSIRVADSLMAPRLAVFNVAVNSLKEKLKVPSTAKFAAPSLQNTDTAAIFIDSGKAIVRGEYDAQNAFGTYLHNRYQVRLYRYNGNWTVFAPNYPWASVDASYTGEVIGAPDFTSMTLTSPTDIPPPPPPPAPDTII